MNRYPPCPFSSEVLGALPHTDSCFVNVLNQDQIGGLQLWMNGKWISVKPNPKALIINIGDLFQVCSYELVKLAILLVITIYSCICNDAGSEQRCLQKHKASGTCLQTSWKVFFGIFILPQKRCCHREWNEAINVQEVHIRRVDGAKCKGC